MIFPTVHLNGTSKDELLRQLDEAYQAITTAQEKLRQAAPNGRDFYLLGPQAIYTAMDEHRARMQKLEDVKNELEKIMEHVDGQN